MKFRFHHPQKNPKKTHTGGTKSYNQCGQKHQYRKEYTSIFFFFAGGYPRGPPGTSKVPLWYTPGKLGYLRGTPIWFPRLPPGTLGVPQGTPGSPYTTNTKIKPFQGNFFWEGAYRCTNIHTDEHTDKISLKYKNMLEL